MTFQTVPVDFELMQRYFRSGATLSYQFRKQQLQNLRAAIEKYEPDILAALFSDLKKSAEEAYSTEVGFLYAELSHTIKHLKSWMQPTRVDTPLIIAPSSSKIIHDPLGVTLIIAPWNYPFQLLMAPLIGAIAGGNCTVLKPSEFTVNTSAVVEKMIAETFDGSYIKVVTGEGAEVVPWLMKTHRFDHVFFTGSIPVGRQIAMMAAEKLVPVTLELGGKSPCIVDKNVNLKVAANRITWGKFTNVGQTCVAPDYLLVHEDRKYELLNLMKKSIHQFYGADPKESPDYGRVVNAARFNKLESYLDKGNVLMGGKRDKNQLYFEPTVMDSIEETDPIMQEEIFGPLLPVFTFRDHQQAIDMINRYPDPLALYVFTNDDRIEKRYTENVAFGGGCVNNTLMHLANAELPFGGVGNSGVGAYHGKFSFERFTRNKAVVKTTTWVDPAAKYPPYKGKMWMLKWLLK